MAFENTAAPNGAGGDSSLSNGSSGGAAGGDGGGGGGRTSMEETIRAAMSRMSDGGDDAGGDDGGSESGRPAGTGTGSGQTREQNGRYGRKAAGETGALNDGTDPNAPTGDEGTDPAAQAAAADQSQQTKQPSAWDTAPQGFRKDSETAKAWATIPETVRKEMHEREAAFHRGIGQYRDAATFGSNIATELLPYSGTMKQHNRAPVEVVKELGSVWNTLVTGSPAEKAQLVLQVIRDYSIDLASLDGAASGTPDQASGTQLKTHPEFVALQHELKTMRDQLTAQERTRSQAEFNAHVDQVEKFGTEVDAKGKPLRPHFVKVRGLMANLIDAGSAESLADAYEQACWSLKETRDLLMAEQDRERQSRDAEQAAKARKAAAANVQTRGTLPASAKPQTMDETIRSNLRRLNGNR